MSLTIKELRDTHLIIKGVIKKKLAEFESNFDKSDEAVFLELCFCILAAGTSAALALNTVEQIKGVIFEADAGKMRSALKKSRYRFHNVRADYIVSTREYLNKDCGFRIKEKIMSFPDDISRREYFAGNKGIKGIAYKEGSHFLRNIGMKGYAILDKHVISLLYQLGVIKEDKRPANRKSYLMIEERMKRFAKKIDIDFDELDLLLWYIKTGTIIK